MSIRDFNDAIKSDPNNRLAISGAGLVLTTTAMPLNEDIYLAWDDGAGFYTTTPDKNIHIETDGILTPMGLNSNYMMLAICDALKGGHPARSDYLIFCRLGKSGVGVQGFFIGEYENGSLLNSNFDAFTFEGTHYWHKFEINWTAQTFTTTFYTNALRTITAFTPKVISLTNNRALRYVYGQQGFNLAGAGGGGATGITQNFNQVTPAIGVTLSAYYQALKRNNRSGRN